MWKVLHTRRGSGGQVQDRGSTRRNNTHGGVIGQRGTLKISRKLVDTGGAGGLE